MTLRTLMILNAVIACAFGVAFVLVPGVVYSLYGVDPSGQLNYMGQLFGGALLTIALITWLMRNVTEPTTRKPIVLALLIGNAVGFVISLIGQLNHAVNTLGWSTVAIYFVLSLGFASIQFRK